MSDQQSSRSSNPLEFEEECPTTETLANFLEGSLSINIRSQVERHVTTCGVCDLLTNRMKDFDDNSELVIKLRSVEERMQSRFNDHLDASWQTNKLVPVQRLRRFLWSPVFAYTLVIALVYPAGLGLLRYLPETDRSGPAADNAALENATVIQLDTMRSASKATLKTESGNRRLLLSFFLPIRDGYRYSAVLTGGASTKRLDINSYDAAGNFLVTCPPLKAGSYSLLVTEATESGTADRTFTFKFSR